MGPNIQITELHYSLVANRYVAYDAPPPVEFETTDGRFRLANGQLQVIMKTFSSTTEEARALIDPTLRAWEARSDLEGTRGDLRFQFDQPVAVDLASPGSVQVHIVGVGMNLQHAVDVAVHITRRSYPPPPGSFECTPDFESLRMRFEGYLDGREPLLSMAYFCFTVLKGSWNGVDKAAHDLNIDKAVLKKISELSSTRGDLSNARKISAQLRPLTRSEQTWLEKVMKAVIYRVGRKSEAAALPMITLADFPVI